MKLAASEVQAGPDVCVIKNAIRFALHSATCPKQAEAGIVRSLEALGCVGVQASVSPELPRRRVAVVDIERSSIIVEL